MENYKAFLKAQTAAEHFLIAHAKGGLEAGIWRDIAMEDVRDLVKHLGFDLVPAVTEEKVAA
jgi:hypothetical protein